MVREKNELVSLIHWDSVALLSLRAFWGWCFQLGTKNTIPESAGDAETILEISIVVLEVVFLQLFIVEGKARHGLASN